MRKYRILLLIAVTFLVSGCESSKYTITDSTLNGNSIYIYDSQQEVCTEWYSMGVEIDDTSSFYIINTCPQSYMVLVDKEYISLLDYLKDNEVSIEELKVLSFGFFSINTSIENIFNINLNDYVLESIVVKELNNEIMVPPFWDTSEIIDLELQDVSEDIVKILSEPLGTNLLCEDMLCRLLYSQGPININLVSEDFKIIIELYENHLNIKKYSTEDEFVSVIYNITDPWGNVDSLYETIYNRYLEINE